jgi:2-polyprenyl-3-methyl-5-hydroxy-6-metoxy-1,4-benzoquinol methylase
MDVNETRLQEFMGKAVGDIGAAISAALVVIGDRLGLYKAMAGAGGLTPAQLAEKTHTHERYVREWLNNQAAGGYVAYDPATGRYSLPPEQALALAEEGSPAFLPGAFQIIAAAFKAVPRIAENFRSGKGMAWGDHDPDLFEGTERFFRPSYLGNLVTSWIPALEGVEKKLREGIEVADVGCGHGASTLLMAQAFPRSRFTGFDNHEPSIRAAAARAKEAGLSDRVKFQVASASEFPGRFSLVAFFDCLHDMADPVGAARNVRSRLDPDGTWMIVEPQAGDRPEHNHNPVGRVFYAASTLVCVPNSLAGSGPALGTQAGPARIREVVVKGGGFSRFRKATETPFNLVLEARP